MVGNDEVLRFAADPNDAWGDSPTPVCDEEAENA